MPLTKRPERAVVIFLASAGFVLWIPVVRLLVGRDERFLRGLGFFAGPRGTLVGWISALGVAVIYARFSITNIDLVAAYWKRLSPLKALTVVVAIPAAIVEEAFFRRAMMDSILPHLLPGLGSIVLWQILVSALIFGFAHAIWGIVTKRLEVSIKVMIATGSVGALLAVVYVVGGRSLAPPIAAHFIIDAVIQPGISFAAFGGEL
jgi:hypothetical protein